MKQGYPLSSTLVGLHIIKVIGTIIHILHYADNIILASSLYMSTTSSQFPRWSLLQKRARSKPRKYESHDLLHICAKSSTSCYAALSMLERQYNKTHFQEPDTKLCYSTPWSSHPSCAKYTYGLQGSPRTCGLK